MDPKPCSLKTSLLRKDFDLLRNSRPTVPMYADGRELLVFRTFSQSGSVPKRVFRHAEQAQRKISAPVQTVQKVRNRQNRFTISWSFALWISFAKVVDPKPCSLKTSLPRKDFDLLRNSRPAVPMYADERELLVFRTFSQSGSVPKRVFRHAEQAQRFFSAPVVFLHFMGLRLTRPPTGGLLRRTAAARPPPRRRCSRAACFSRPEDR